MNIEKLARVALGFLKTKETNFPKHGVIAGGSLGNLIWEQVSGNVAVVNDIDIFIFDREVNAENVYGDSTKTTDNKKVFYRSLEKIYYKDYTGLCEGSRTRDFYLIERTENSGLFNYVYYSATSEKPEGPTRRPDGDRVHASGNRSPGTSISRGLRAGFVGAGRDGDPGSDQALLFGRLGLREHRGHLEPVVPKGVRHGQAHPHPNPDSTGQHFGGRGRRRIGREDFRRLGSTPSAGDRGRRHQ